MKQRRTKYNEVLNLTLMRNQLYERKVKKKTRLVVTNFVINISCDTTMKRQQLNSSGFRQFALKETKDDVFKWKQFSNFHLMMSQYGAKSEVNKQPSWLFIQR